MASERDVVVLLVGHHGRALAVLRVMVSRDLQPSVLLRLSGGFDLFSRASGSVGIDAVIFAAVFTQRAELIHVLGVQEADNIEESAALLALADAGHDRAFLAAQPVFVDADGFTLAEYFTAGGEKLLDAEDGFLCARHPRLFHRGLSGDRVVNIHFEAKLRRAFFAHFVVGANDGGLVDAGLQHSDFVLFFATAACN